MSKEKYSEKKDLTKKKFVNYGWYVLNWDWLKCHKFHFKSWDYGEQTIYIVGCCFISCFFFFGVCASTKKPERFNSKTFSVVVVSAIARPEKKRESAATIYNGIMLHFDIRFDLFHFVNHSDTAEKNTCIKSLLFINLSSS